jgi:hypothetical protein
MWASMAYKGLNKIVMALRKLYHDQITDIDSHYKSHLVLDSSVNPILCLALDEVEFMQHCAQL